MKISVKVGEWKEFIKKWQGKGWFLLNTICSATYLLWRIFFTIPFEYGAVSIVAGILLFVVEVLGMVEALVHYANMSSVKEYKLPDVPKELFPHVDVFIATYSEEPALLYKTINGCKHMDYPDKSKVHIYLCDDNRRPQMRALADKMGIHYLDRENNEGAKAGNLNNALKHSSSPYIVTFDADMIPKSDFLMKTIPYYVDCELKNAGRNEEDKIKLGLLQTPQSFYNPDLFQFNLFSESRIPNEQDYFYKDIQVARTRTNSVIYGGSNTVLSREALEDIGGFFTGAITEDFATGILIQKKGYVSLGLGEPLASGMSPTDLKSLIQQRVRWARGVIATGRKMHIYTSKDLSLAQKINYWASIWYWYAPLKRLIYVLCPMLYATFGFMVFKCTLPQILIFWLPMYVTSSMSLRMLSRNLRTTKWTNVYEMVLFPFMLLPVMLESFGISLKKFKVTSKSTQQKRETVNLLYMVPFLIMIGLTGVGIINCIRIMFDSGSFGPIVVLFWLVNNLFLLVMSLFFVHGRNIYRKSERVSVSLPCILEDRNRSVVCVTKDISESGISVLLDEPYYFETNRILKVTVNSDRYQAKLKTQIVFVSKKGNKWNYSMKILDYCDTYDDYLQLLYDRIPVLPLEIKKDSGSFEDLKINTQKRAVSPFYQKRQHPRLLLDAVVEYRRPNQDDKASMTGEYKGDEDRIEGTVRLYDFNYVYVSMDMECEKQENDRYLIYVADNLCLDCIYEADNRSGYKMFRVQEIEELQRDAEKAKQLLSWVVEKHENAMQREEEIRKALEQKRKVEKKKEFDETELV